MMTVRIKPLTEIRTLALESASEVRSRLERSAFLNSVSIERDAFGRLSLTSSSFSTDTLEIHFSFLSN